MQNEHLEVNDRGNTILRDAQADSRLGLRGFDRYFYDFNDGFRAKWRQYDTGQDASYFGMWVNVAERMTFTYCEGDRILVVCPTLESFRAELADAERFYGDPPPAFVAFTKDDAGKWMRTDIYDPRLTI